MCHAIGVARTYLAGTRHDITGEPVGHAWCEVWDGYRWVHADPTWSIWPTVGVWDAPDIYYSWLSWPECVYFDRVGVYAKGNDSLYGYGEPSDTDWIFACYHDFHFGMGYDGPNQYCTTSPPYDPPFGRYKP